MVFGRKKMTRQHPQTANAPKAKKPRKRFARAPEARAPAGEIAKWMAAAKREGRSVSNWLRRLANDEILRLSSNGATEEETRG